MTIDRGVVAARAARAREMLALLEHARAAGRQAFLQDPLLRAATERALQIAIEACLDIGHHVISREGFERPGDYAEVFRILGRNGVVAAGLAQQLEGAARFRNRLVHVYVDLDPGEVFRVATEDARDLERFLAAIVARYALA